MPETPNTKATKTLEAIRGGYDRAREAYVNAYNGLYARYQAINNRAEKGERITARDFNDANKEYNRQRKRFEKDVDKVFATARKAIEKAEEKKDDALAERIRNEMTPPSIANRLVNSLTNTAALDRVYERDVIGAARPKDISRADMSGDGTALLTSLLATNPGVAIGEYHDHPAARQLIRKSLDAMKAAGVDTLYIETNSMKEEPPGFLQLYINGFKPGMKNREAAEREHYQLILDARERGIRIVEMDDPGPAREAGIHNSAQRLASTNFTWKDVIEKDRRHRKKGKYVVFAGSAHFINNQDKRGLVDEGLGIPVIVPARGEEGRLVKGQSANGADFYVLSSGYFDTVRDVVVTDTKQLADGLEKFSALPGIGSLVNALRDTAVRWQADLREQSNAISEDIFKPAEDKAPTVPTGLPGNSAHGTKDR